MVSRNNLPKSLPDGGKEPAILGHKENNFLELQDARVTEGDEILDLPSLCVAQMLQVAFLSFLLGVQPAHYRGATSTQRALVTVKAADTAN